MRQYNFQTDKWISVKCQKGTNVDHKDELKNLENDEIDRIIKERTSSWWKQAIIVYVDVPSDEEANDHE